MKKLCIIIAALFSFTLVSCAGEENEVFSEEFSENSHAIDFDGRTFTVMYDDTISGLFAYQQDTSLGDELTEKIRTAENEMKFKLAFSAANDPVSYIPSSTAAGLDEVQILFIRSHNLRQLGNAGYLTDIAVVADIIDYTDSFRWGSYETLELMTCKGVLCGVTPACWVDNVSPFYFAVITNNDILRRSGYTNPHEYLDNSEWTRDLFSEIVASCTDVNTGIYGLETGESFIYRMAVHTNGVGLIDGQTGKSAWHSDAALSGLEWAYSFVNEYRDCIAFTGESNDNFLNASAAMTTCDAVRICKTLAFDEDLSDFSVMPFPSGDGKTYGGFLSTTLNTVSIPITNGYAEETAAVIEAIFRPMDSTQTLDGLKAYYSSNVFFSTRDIDILYELIESAEWCYWVENAVTPIDKVISSVSSGKYSPSQAIEAYIPGLDTIIEEYILPNKEGLASYFN